MKNSRGKEEINMAGSVSFANWSVCYFISTLNGDGLKVSASFNGKSVISSAGTPFVLVPYHGALHTYKDGLNPNCGGLPFKTLIPPAPNCHNSNLPPGAVATNDDEYNAATNTGGGVYVEKHPKGWIDPEHIEIWAKFQCGNYQYVHRYVFYADGRVDVEVGLGGKLIGDGPERGHIHNFYFRLDLDIDGSGNNQVQRMNHNDWGNPGDSWDPILTEKKENFSGSGYTKWRVVNKTAKPNGQLRSYELIPGGDGAPDGTYSNGDLWATLYKSGAETGSDVTCNDKVLTNNYINPVENIDGKDVVLWYCMRTHHVTRYKGEEKNVLPYHYVGFHLEARDFLDDTPLGIYNTNPPSPF